MTSAYRYHSAPIETGFAGEELKFQYENHEPLPLMVEEYMLGLTVDDVIRGLLQLELLSYVEEKPENLKMYLLLPGTSSDEKEHLQEMEGGRKMSEYRKDFNRCSMIKMLKQA